MANHGELAKVIYATSLGRTSSSTIWRTVVFAGAMLAAPIGAIGCGGGNKKPTVTEPSAADKAAADKAVADKAAADQATADKAAADKAVADKAAEDQAAADKAAADKAAADQAAADAKSKKRPRGGNSRPTGRGFVLS